MRHLRRLGSVGKNIRPGIVIWAISIAAGFGFLGSYKMRAGEGAAAPSSWPDAVPFQKDPARLDLVLFAHPLCPCTRATMSELETILARTDNITATVCFPRPEDAPAGWDNSELVKAARRIRGLRVFVDRGGLLEREFGTVTSGQVLVYDTRARLVFAGGITGSRGHVGDNAGRRAVLALANDQAPPALANTPVYGCTLPESFP